MLSYRILGNCEEEPPKKPVGRQSDDVGRLSADSWPTVGSLSADKRPTGFARNIGRLLADSRSTVGNVSVAEPVGNLSCFTVIHSSIVKTQLW